MAQSRFLGGAVALVLSVGALALGTSATESASAAAAAAPASITATLTSGRDQKIYEVTNKAVGAGPELTPADVTREIAGYSGDIVVDIDPTNQTVTVNSVDQRQAQYDSAVVHVTDADLTHLDVVTDRWNQNGPVTVTGRPGDWTLTWATPFFTYGRDSSVFSYAPRAQSIAFTSTPPTDATVGGTYAATATSTSGAAVAFSSGAPGVCTVSATGAVSLVAGGTCVVLGDQGGTADYAPAPRVSQSFAVAKQPQSIAFTSTPPTSAVVGSSATVTATSTSGGPVTFSSGSPGVCTVSAGGAVVFTGEGTCTVRADQAGTTDYLPAPQVTQVVAVSPAPVDRRADLGVSFTTKAPDWARPGSVVRIDLDTVNAGPSVAPGAVTTLRLPKGWKVRRLTDGAVVAGRRLSVSGDLAPGTTRPTYVVLEVGPKARGKLTARVTSTVPDPAAANDTDTLKVTPSKLRGGRP